MKKCYIIFCFIFIISMVKASDENNNNKKVHISITKSSPSVTEGNKEEAMFGGDWFNAIVDKETNQSKIFVDDIFNKIVKNIRANYGNDQEPLINPWESVIIYHQDKEYKQGDVIVTEILENKPNRFHAKLIKKPNIVFDKGCRRQGKYKNGSVINISIPLTIYEDDILGFFVDVTKVNSTIEQKITNGDVSKEEGGQEINKKIENSKSNKIVTNKSSYFTKTNFFILFLLSLLGVSSYQAGWWKVLNFSK